MTTTYTHHETDLLSMRDDVIAIIEDGHGSIDLAGLDWLDTDEGKNHRHMLGLWDTYEDADVYDEIAARNPEAATYFLHEAGVLHHINDENYLKSYAAYLYAFELFDYVVDNMREQLSNNKETA